MPEHGRGVVHESRRKNQTDRLGIKFFEPLPEPLTGQRGQARAVKLETLLQPVISGDESTLRRLFGTADEIVGKELGQRRS
jgi:hypothetical protein